MRRFLVLTIVVLSGGCSSVGYTLSGVPLGGQQVTMDRGAVSVRSEWRKSAVSVSAASANFKDQLGFWVNVENRGPLSANFGTEDIAISADGHSWRSVETYEQIVVRLENKAFWDKMAASVLIGIEGGLISSAVGRTDVDTTVSSRWGTSTARTTIVNHGEQAMAMAGTQAAAMAVTKQIDAQTNARVSDLEKVALRTTTVRPDERFGGLVLAECPGVLRGDGAPFYVRVHFSGDDHVFQFQSHKPGAFVPVQPDPSIVAAEVNNALDGTQIAQRLALRRDAEVTKTSISTSANVAGPVSQAGPPMTSNTSATADTAPPLRFQTYDTWQKSQSNGKNED